MLATPPHHHHRQAYIQPHHVYLPAHPSPLSPRSANIYGRRNHGFGHGDMSSSPSAPSSDVECDRLDVGKDRGIDGTTNAKENEMGGERSIFALLPFSQRAVKKAPSPQPSELAQRRRGIFLRKVKEEREESRFRARGEDILRLDFMQRQRQWEAQLARTAPEQLIPSDPSEPEEDDLEIQDVHISSAPTATPMQISAPSTQQQQPPEQEQEVEEIAQRELEELEALLAYMPVDDEGKRGQAQGSEHAYSDEEEDYEALFDLVIENGAVQREDQIGVDGADGGGPDPMDMS